MYNKTTCISPSHSINEGNILARMKIGRKVKKKVIQKKKKIKIKKNIDRQSSRVLHFPDHSS